MAKRSLSNPTNANFSFSRVSAPGLPRSVFNRSSTHKTTMNEGYLVPFYIDEILPGDTVNMEAHVVARLSTLEVPVMDNMFLDMHWWFTPYRLLWENWEAFISGYSGRGESTDYEIPYMISDLDPEVCEVMPFSVGDYFGLPIGQNIDPETYPISALPYRAYNLIYNEWYRDQNLQDEVFFSTQDGPDNMADYTLLKRNKRPDYFSTCLPWPQKGNAVLMPLGSTAPVIGTGIALGLDDGTDTRGLLGASGTNALWANPATYGDPIGQAETAGTNFNSTVAVGVTDDPMKSGLVADLSAAAAASINNIRLAVAMQQVLERDARGGTRYTEHLVSHWRVSAEDYRLQRPEYLGGSSDPMGVYQVAQTSASETNSAQANLAAYGQMASKSRFTKSFVEHGVLMCLLNFRADQTYQEGIRRMWTRRTRWEFYLPDLAHLGEQAVRVGELTYNIANPSYNQVFGYQERWAEYRYMPSIITGALRSQYAQSLDVWHLALDFIGDAGTGLPELNENFIQDNPPIGRILNYDGADEYTHLIVDGFFRVKHARPLPVFSNPGLLRF